jgi:hypothetical protein
VPSAETGAPAARAADPRRRKPPGSPSSCNKWLGLVLQRDLSSAIRGKTHQSLYRRQSGRQQQSLVAGRRGSA